MLGFSIMVNYVMELMKSEGIDVNGEKLWEKYNFDDWMKKGWEKLLNENN